MNKTPIERIVSAAVSLIQAEHAVTNAKHQYREAQEEYFHVHGRPEGKIDPDDDRYLPFFNETNEQYQALQKAKRKGYNARRRLRDAVKSHLVQEAAK